MISYPASPAISIVTASFNSASYLEATAKSVFAQTFDDWEWIVVDDCSTDQSLDMIRTFCRDDKRVVPVNLPENVGAAQARNVGIERSRGRYIAFLDADDIWGPRKLEKQLAFLRSTGSFFSYTGFQYVNERGDSHGALVTPPPEMTYRKALKDTTILTSTVMIDRGQVRDLDLRFPDLRRGQDTALWWRLLRMYGPARGLSESLTRYRNAANSLSSNPVRALRRTWVLYRRVENLGFYRSGWFFANYVCNAVARRVGYGASRENAIQDLP